MRIRGFGLVLAVFAACAGQAHAEDQSARIADRLRSQGFADVSVSRTLLGRTRIVADGKPGHREIVLDPRTGEVLRDLFLESGRNGAQASDSGKDGSSGNSGSGSGSSGSGSGDSGSGNSGSGSSGSGSGSGSDDGHDDSGKDRGGSDDGGRHDGSDDE